MIECMVSTEFSHIARKVGIEQGTGVEALKLVDKICTNVGYNVN